MRRRGPAGDQLQRDTEAVRQVLRQPGASSDDEHRPRRRAVVLQSSVVLHVHRVVTVLAVRVVRRRRLPRALRLRFRSEIRRYTE